MAQPPHAQLREIARQVADAVLERAQRRKPELVEIKRKQMEIEDLLQSAHLCDQRARNFRPEVGGNFHCPGCWICNEAEVAMTPIPSDAKDDLFRCPVCGQSIEIKNS